MVIKANESSQHSDILLSSIVAALQEKKLKDVVSLDLRKLPSPHVDIMVVCHANSDTQVEAAYRAVEEQVKEDLKEKPWHVEGKTGKEWVLMDYVNVVVNIFLRDKRDFYALEELWADAEKVHYETFQ